VPSLKILSLYLAKVTEEQRCKGYVGILEQWVMTIVKQNFYFKVQRKGDDKGDWK
jgi:hypothetical protein